MSILDSIKADIDKLNAAIQKDEAWVVNEINRGWALLQSVGHTVEVDIEGIFNYIATHQQQIIADLHNALVFLAPLETALGASSPIGAVVAGALTAINAATAATNVLGKAVVAGNTPLSTAVNAFHALKDAQTAVNAVIKSATAKPAAASAAAS